MMYELDKSQIYQESEYQHQEQAAEDYYSGIEQEIKIKKNLRLIPPAWIQNCPVQKLANNLKLVDKFLSKEIFPKMQTLDFTTDIDPYLYNEQETVNYLLRVEVAKHMIEHESKLLQFKKILTKNKFICKEEIIQSDKVKPKNYNVIAQTVVTHAFKRLEEFIKKNFKLNIECLSRIECQRTMTILKSCSQQFSEDICEALFYFINLTYNIPQTRTVKVSQIMKLYKSILLMIKFKMEKILHDISSQRSDGFQLKTFKQLVFKTKLKTIWNAQFERFLLKKYREDSNFGVIRDAFRKKYTDVACVFSSQELKQRFDSIIRRAMKIIRDKIQQLNSEHIPKLFGLNQKNFKKIAKGKKSHSIRLWLLDIYDNAQINQDELLSIVNFMNNYIQENQSKGSLLSQLNSQMSEICSVLTNSVSQQTQSIFELSSQIYQEQPETSKINQHQISTTLHNTLNSYKNKDQSTWDASYRDQYTPAQ